MFSESFRLLYDMCHFGSRTANLRSLAGVEKQLIYVREFSTHRWQGITTHERNRGITVMECHVFVPHKVCDIARESTKSTLQVVKLESSHISQVHDSRALSCFIINVVDFLSEVFADGRQKRTCAIWRVGV